MKKILFTEQQMKYILGESEVFNYLDKSDQGCDASIDSDVDTGEEVYTNDLDADEFPTTDKIAASKVRANPFYRNCGFGAMYESKKKGLNERNHQLDGKTFRLGKNVNRDIDNLAAANSDDTMLNNMSNEKDASANCLYVRQNRLRKMKKEDPERYRRINGKRLEKTIGDTLNRATFATKAEKSQIEDKNLSTVQKPVNSTKKGHGKNNTPTIYYDNE